MFVFCVYRGAEILGSRPRRECFFCVFCVFVFVFVCYCGLNGGLEPETQEVGPYGLDAE